MEIKHKITVEIKYYKLFLPLLYLVVVITFFSCQNKENKQQEFKNIKVVTDTSLAKSVTLDTTVTSKKKLDQAPDLPKADQTELKQTTPIVTKEVDENKSSKSDKVKKDDLQSTLKPLSNTNAEFPGGIDQFHSFFMKEYKKPENVNYWKLNFTLAFAVEKNGTVSFLECSPAVEEPLEKEIIRVLSLCPKWMPGELNGKKVRMQYSVPILLK